MIKYLEDNFQYIIKTILLVKLFPALVIAALEAPQDKPLKTKFLDRYLSKNHLMCRNFFWQYEDYFTTNRAIC